MPKSPEPEQRLYREYRAAQRRQTLRSCATVGIPFLLLCLIAWFVKPIAQRRVDDMSTATRHVTTATVTHAVVISGGHGGVSCYITLDNIEGRTVTVSVDYGAKVFAIGKPVRVHYSVGQSGEVYVGEVEPLP